MEVRCERCRAQYVFSDEQVGEHGLTVRCSNCGHLFKVKRKALVVTLPVGPEETGATAVSAADAHRAAAVQAAAQAVFAETERREWSLRQPAGQTYTFKDMSTLHRWIVERKAHREDEISRANEPWRRLGSIPELQSFFAVVEAAERAAHVAVPAAQPTMLQFPAAGYPGPGTKPPATRTDQVFPPAAPGKTEFFSAPPPPPAAAPAAGRTEFFAPPPPPPAMAPPAPAAGRTEFFAPPPPPSAPARPAATTEKAVPIPPPPAPVPSRLDGIFTPDPMPVHEADPFAVSLGGTTSPEVETEQGLPPPPPPSAAPQRSPTAAWEGQGTTPAKASSREPAWTSADQQTGGAMAVEEPEPPRRRGLWPVLAVMFGAAAAVGAAGWWFILRQPPPAPTPVAAAPPPAVVPPAAAPPPPAPAPTPAPVPEVAKAEPPRPDPAAKAAEAAPAATKPPEPAPVAAKPAEPAEPPPEKPAATPAGPAAKAPASPAKETGPRGVRGLLAQARKLRDRGKSAQALDLYGKAVALDGENAEALAGRGWCYLELSQYAPAEASFQAALEADPEGADALLGLAETLRYEGRRADAVKYYERYLEAHPDGEDAVAARNAIKSLKE